MCEVPVFYATTEGQTRRIAERMATTLRHVGLESAAIDLASPEARAINWHGVRAVILGASLHAGKHQGDADSFARRNLAELNARPSVFISVSLSICSSIQKDVEAACAIARACPDHVGWQPTRVVCIAGRLAYTQYGLLKRFIMRRIARKSGGPTDTSRDHELTNWDEVRAIATDVAVMIRGDAASAATA